jgi:hypothetical protein
MALSQFKKDEIAFELRHEDAAMKQIKSKPSKVLPMKTVPLVDALAVAYAAYRINKETYIKDLRRFENAATQFPNKDLVRYYFERTNDMDWVPTDVPNFQPTQEDYTNVSEALKWMKRYVMLGLGELDDFKRQMVEELTKDEVPIKGMGRIAFAPEFIARDRHESGLKKEIRIEYRDSQHLGKEKDPVEAVVKILDKRYSTQWESYNFTAVTTEGNLVSYMNKFDQEVGSMKRIKAKVKAQTKNKLFSADETRLNYVKLYKV